MSDDGLFFNVAEAKTGPQEPVALDNVLAAVTKLRGLKRMIICHESRVDIMEAGVRDEGLEHVVEVIGSRHLEPTQAYIVKTSLFDQRFYGKHDVGEFNDGGPIRD